jgi:hypothetical protein
MSLKMIRYMYNIALLQVLAIQVCMFHLAMTTPQASALSSTTSSNPKLSTRRQVVVSLPFFLTGAAIIPRPCHAYTPDPDPLRESLYLVSRVQEATCLQERYIDKNRPPIPKMKLTLRLVDKSYRLLDQINFISKFMEPDSVVPATQVGNEAVDALQEAIDFVFAYKQQQQQDGAAVAMMMMTMEQRDFLKESLTTTREKLFEFLNYLPEAQQEKVKEARARVEEENSLNKDEFDPDLATDAGVYNPVVLPWTTRRPPKKDQ